MSHGGGVFKGGQPRTAAPCRELTPVSLATAAVCASSFVRSSCYGGRCELADQEGSSGKLSFRGLHHPRAPLRACTQSDSSRDIKERVRGSASFAFKKPNNRTDCVGVSRSRAVATAVAVTRTVNRHHSSAGGDVAPLAGRTVGGPQGRAHPPPVRNHHCFGCIIPCCTRWR